MLKKEDIEHLSVLARIAVSGDEQESLAKDLDSVLAYVSEVSNITTEADVVPRAGELRNVMREDTDTNSGGTYSDMILANAPHTENRYVKVSQIQS